MNKQFLKVGLVALMAGIYSAGASAAGPVNGSAEVTVASAVTLTESTGMNFGIMVPGTVATTVSLNSALAHGRNVSAGDGTLVTGGTVAAGAFQIGGTTGATVSIAVADLGDLGALVFTPATAAATNLGATHTIDAVAANNILYVGGDVVIPTGTAAGNYANAAAYSVTVNYQ